MSRQLRLTFVSFTTALALSLGAGLLIGRGSMLLFFIGGLLAVIALFLGIGLWGGGEDPDDEPRWIAGMTIALLAVIGSVSLGLPKVYQDWRGEPVAAVVAEDADGPSRAGTEQTIEVKRATDGEPLGRLNIRDDRDLHAGDRVTVVVDPAGWFRPDSGQQPPYRARMFAYSLALGGSVLVVLLTAARTVRDLRRANALRAGRAPTVRGRRTGVAAAGRGSPGEQAAGDKIATGKAAARRSAVGTDAEATAIRGGGARAKKAAGRTPADRQGGDTTSGSRQQHRPVDPNEVTDLLESADRTSWGSGDSGDSD